ncbi:hypothetical protein ACHAWF_002209, partial [Thalassiosira exigua]
IIPCRTSAQYGTVQPDATDAIANALRASKEYGTISKEARLAWDIVEEMDSNDSSPAYDVAPNSIDAPRDYYDRIRSLDEAEVRPDEAARRADQGVGAGGSLPRPPPRRLRGGGLKAALADAKAAVAVYGSSSAEAKKAWEKLDSCFDAGEGGVLRFSEECDVESNASYRYSAAALKAHHLYDTAIEAAVLDESLEALGMIEGLSKFVSLKKRRLDAAQGSVGP